MAPDYSRFPTNILVIENVHPLSEPHTICETLWSICRVEAKEIETIQFWPVLVDGARQMNAYVEFLDMAVAIRIYAAVGERKMTIPPPLILRDASVHFMDESEYEDNLNIRIRMWGGFIGYFNPSTLTDSAWVCKMCLLPNTGSRLACSRCKALPRAQDTSFTASLSSLSNRERRTAELMCMLDAAKERDARIAAERERLSIGGA